MRIALVTDTHVRPPYDDGQAAFPSDAGHNARNRVVAEAVRALAPDVVVHLGDVVHPIPTLPSHADALAVARQLWGDLGAPLLVVPGNHDVGDKHTSAAAPATVADSRAAFVRTWGPAWQVRTIGGVRLVTVDGGLLGADTDEARAQRTWLEQTLAQGGRTVVLTHYPPFLLHPDEPEHYDNLPEPGRSWLLERVADAGVEALISGHVHRFFYGRYRGVDLYTIPSLAFTRPEYAHLRPVPPADGEHGRDDVEHLGFAVLELDADGHHLDVVRPFSRAPGPPAPPGPLGVWLREPLGRVAELPLGSLDPLTRKQARDDAALLQVIDLGLSRVRVPLPDLGAPASRDRLRWLARRGVRLTVFSSGLPTAEQAARVEAWGAPVEWEVVCRPADLDGLALLLERWSGPPLTAGRIGRPLATDDPYFSHFPRQGFDPTDPALPGLAPHVARIAFRIGSDRPIEPAIARAVARATELGVGATLHVELPLATEATAATDDDAVTERVLAAHRAAVAHPDAHVLLDLLADEDRGYWPRHGLVDRADRPRPAYVALKQAR